jgi:tetratricopeptide (TPR) repeat protein
LAKTQYGEQHPLTISILSNLGAAYRKTGRLEEALKVSNAALAAARSVYGSPNSHEAQVLLNRSSVYLAMGDAKSALEDTEASLAETGVSGSVDQLMVAALANKAVALSKLGQLTESMSLIAHAEEAVTNNPQRFSPLFLAEVMTSKGLVAAEGRDQVAAESAFDKAREIYTSVLGPDSNRLAQLNFFEGQLALLTEKPLGHFDSTGTDFWLHPPHDWWRDDETESMRGLVPNPGQPLPTPVADLRKIVDGMKVPPGFKVSIYAADVPQAREMALGSKGTLFVGTWDAGIVNAIVTREERESSSR